MDATTVAVDLAKSVFQLAEAADQWQIVGTHRLTRRQFERFFANCSIKLVIVEACGSAHYWARWLTALGIPVRMLPPAHVRRYVLGNKTDAADCAARCWRRLVIQRSGRCASRASSNRDFKPCTASEANGWPRAPGESTACAASVARGVTVPRGARTGLRTMAALVADAASAIPAMLRSEMLAMLDEVRNLEARIAQVERELATMTRAIPACQLLMRYLRTLLTHGARSVLQAAARHSNSGRQCQGLHRWALELAQRTHHNKATCAGANKLARICFATLRAQQP